MSSLGRVNQQLLRPSPMDVGAVVSSSWHILRRRPGLFAGLMLVPLLLVIPAVGAGVILAVTSEKTSPDAGLQAVLIVVIVLASLASILLQYRALAMVILATVEVARGPGVSVGQLWARTRGIMWRLLGLVLLGCLGIILLVAIVAAAFVPLGLMASDSGSRSGSSTMAPAAIFVTMLLYLGFGVLAAFLTVRLLYVVPAMVFEGRGPIAAVARSWAMTRGAFWRTLGYYLLVSLIVGAVTYAGVLLMMTPMILIGGLTSRGSQGAPGVGWFIAFGALWLILMALSVMTSAYQWIYQTVMYVDQVGRERLAAAGWPPAPGSPPTHLGPPSLPPGSPYGPPSDGPPSEGPPPGRPRLPFMPD